MRWIPRIMEKHNDPERLLADAWPQAEAFESEVRKAVVGQDSVLRLLTIAVFSRGHALLEGSVGVASAHFRVRARAAAEGQHRTVVAWVERDPRTGDVRILQWQEGEG